MFNNKSILITGGTGSFGQSFTDYIVKNYKPKKLIIFSRDEFKQYSLKNEFKNHKNFEKLRFFIGDIRDLSRLNRALENVDIVIHAAALKQVDTAEYNPSEFIKTNIIGTENVVNASINQNVKKVISLSTDKAASPINLYGATKLCAEKIELAANNTIGKKKIIFSVVRYGNVSSSRGSVIPSFYEQKKTGILKITHPKMTRFNISLNESIDFVIKSIKLSKGGEIFIPKMTSYNILDLAESIAPKTKKKTIGIRPGEKIHEELIGKHESRYTFDMGNFFVIVNNGNKNLFNFYKSLKQSKQLKENFTYNSENNQKKLNIKQLKEIIK